VGQVWGRKKYILRFLVENPEEKGHFEALDLEDKIMLKGFLN
jgi:hypothetical protein